MLSKTQILAAQDIETREVEVPEWGGTVIIKGLTGRERERLEAMSRKFRDGKPDENIRARFLAMAMVDETGAPIFGPGDVEALGNKSAVVLDRLFDVAMALAGISAEAVEEITENF